MAGLFDDIPMVQPGQKSAGLFDDIPMLSDGSKGGPSEASVNTEQVRAEYDAKPWYSKIPQAADDVVRLVANAATFGYADKWSANLPGGAGSVEDERRRTEEARARAGSAGIAAELTGSIATPAGMARNGITLVGRGAPAAWNGIKGLLGRSAVMGVEGAGYGALSAAGHDQDMTSGAMMGAAFGAAGNTAVEGVGRAVRGVAGAIGPKAAIPTREGLESAARNAYQAADDAGVIFAPQAAARLQKEVVNNLAEFGYHPDLQPGAKAVLSSLANLEGQNVTLKGLDTIRKVAANGYMPGNASNNKIIAGIISKIDDLLSNPQAGDILLGDAQAGASALGSARKNWQQLSKADAVEKAMSRAELNAASAGSGANIDNAMRQQFKALARSLASRNFTPDEKTALMTAIMGTPGQNALRLLGKAAPTNAVSTGLSSGLGLAIGGGYGAVALPVAGFLAKNTADKLGKRNAQGLLDTIMAGGAKPMPNVFQRLTSEAEYPLARGLMAAAAYNNGRNK